MPETATLKRVNYESRAFIDECFIGQNSRVFIDKCFKMPTITGLYVNAVGSP